jgi:hypothetical protein
MVPPVRRLAPPRADGYGGGSLDSLVVGHGALPEGAVTGVATQALSAIAYLCSRRVVPRQQSTLVLLLLHPKGYSTARHRSRTIEAEQAQNCQAPQAVDLIWSGGSNRITLTTVFNSTMTRRGHDSIIKTFNEQ